MKSGMYFFGLFKEICQYKILPSFLDLLFPLKCLSCQVILPESLQLLCKSCLNDLSPSQPAERCRTCYCYKEGEACLFCSKEPSPFIRTFAAFDGCTPLEALANKLGSADGAFLANSLASLMVLQLENSPLREFEVLVPSHDLASKRLTKALGELLKMPVATDLQSIERPEEKRVLMVSTGHKPFSEYRNEGIRLAESFPRSLQMLFLMRGYR